MEKEDILVEKNGKKICWRKLTPSDEAEVRRLTLKCVLMREPISVAFIEAHSAEDVLPYVMSFVMTLFKQNYSIGAYDANNKDKLCAMMILSAQVPSDEKHDFNSFMEGEKPALDSVTFQLIRYLNVLADGLDEHVGQHKSMMIEMSVVDDSYLKMGIMTTLRRKAEIIARENDARYLTSISTSKFTQQIAAKQGYKELKEVKYKDYVDEVTGKKPLMNVLPPHVSGKVMCLDLTE